MVFFFHAKKDDFPSVINKYVTPVAEAVPVTKEFKSMKTFNHKIPPILPLPKGGIMPLFSKEG